MKEHIIINNDRTVSIPASVYKVGNRFDHGVNKVIFDCPRYADEEQTIDLSTMKIYINYVRSDKEPLSSLATNITVDETDSTIMHFVWDITRNVTFVDGVLDCLVCIKTTNAEGVEERHWNSDIFSKLFVGKGMENEVAIAEENIDLITQLLLEVDTAKDEVSDGINTVDEKVGPLKNLITDDKSNVVAAVNEVKQSSDNVAESVDGLKEDLANCGLNEEIDISTFSTCNGYITSGGSTVDEANSQYRYTEFKYKLCKGDTIEIILNNIDSSNFALIRGYSFDEVGKNLLVYNSNYKKYCFTADEDYYIRFCYKNNNIYSINIIHSIKNSSEKYQIYNPKTFPNGYITKQGSLYTVEGNTGGFGYQEISMNIGDKVKVFVKVPNTNACVIAMKNNEFYVPIFVGESGTKVYEYTAKDSCTIVVSVVKSFYSSYVEVIRNIDSVVDALNNKIAEFDDNTPNYLTMFHKIGVVADSLGSGELGINTESGTVYIDKYEYSWLSNIARKNGLEKVHYSKGGLTCKTWLSSSYKTALENESVKCNAYYIALGTNDSLNMPYELGTVDDSIETETFCGLYKKIIETVKTSAPNAVIFCLSLYNRNYLSYSNAIKNICNLYNNVYFIDFVNKSDLLLSSSYDEKWLSVGHFSTLGYFKVSENIQRITNDVINDNLLDFRYFGKDD